MDTLEEKLLQKMAACHYKSEILNSAAASAYAFHLWIEYYLDGNTNRNLANKNIAKSLANLELHIKLLKLALYPNTQELNEQFVQETAKKYKLL